MGRLGGRRRRRRREIKVGVGWKSEVGHSCSKPLVDQRLFHLTVVFMYFP